MHTVVPVHVSTCLMDAVGQELFGIVSKDRGTYMGTTVCTVFPHVCDGSMNFFYQARCVRSVFCVRMHGVDSQTCNLLVVKASSTEFIESAYIRNHQCPVFAVSY